MRTSRAHTLYISVPCLMKTANFWFHLDSPKASEQGIVSDYKQVLLFLRWSTRGFHTPCLSDRFSFSIFASSSKNSLSFFNSLPLAHLQQSSSLERNFPGPETEMHDVLNKPQTSGLCHLDSFLRSADILDKRRVANMADEWLSPGSKI